MNCFKYIKNILILFLLFNSACTNTRMIVEGTKKVINKLLKKKKKALRKKIYLKDIIKLVILIKLMVLNIFQN